MRCYCSCDIVHIWWFHQVTMVPTNIVDMQLPWYKCLPLREEIHMRRAVRCQQQEHLTVVSLGAVCRCSSFEHLLGRSRFSIRYLHTEKAEAFEKAVPALEQGHPQPYSRDSAQEIAWFGWSRAQRMPQCQVRWSWRVQQHQEVHIVTGAPELRGNLVGEYTTNTKSADCVRTAKLRR